MTNPRTSNWPKRIGALLLAIGMTSVWLLGARAALSTSIYEVKHACCHHEELAASCLTLCASANWTATASAEQAAPAHSATVVWFEAVQPTSTHNDILVTISAVNHSPPLYLQHSALLI